MKSNQYWYRFLGEDLTPLVEESMERLRIKSFPRWARFVAAHFLQDDSALAKKLFELEKNRLGLD